VRFEPAQIVTQLTSDRDMSRPKDAAVSEIVWVLSVPDEIRQLANSTTDYHALVDVVPE
jgi:hypothetical protein